MIKININLIIILIKIIIKTLIKIKSINNNIMIKNLKMIYLLIFNPKIVIILINLQNIKVGAKVLE